MLIWELPGMVTLIDVFYVDETGRFIEGYYIVGLLAKAFLQKEPGSKIVHDPRLTWNTIDISDIRRVLHYSLKLDMHLLKKRCA